MIVRCKKDMNCHYPLSSQAARTVRLFAQLLGSILNLEAVESVALQAVTLPFHPRFRHSNIPFLGR
jgi:hypothetical protein